MTDDRALEFPTKHRNGRVYWSEERFWKRVDKAGGIPAYAPHLGPCWLWTGTLNTPGYGQLKIDNKYHGAHRVAYELIIGPIPNGLVIDHLCRVHRCVNPAHLEPVTCRENLMRGVGPTAQRAAQTHCKRGHEFTPENTRIQASGNRACRICQRARRRARYRARRSTNV